MCLHNKRYLYNSSESNAFNGFTISKIKGFKLQPGQLSFFITPRSQKTPLVDSAFLILHPFQR